MAYGISPISFMDHKTARAPSSIPLEHQHLFGKIRTVALRREIELQLVSKWRPLHPAHLLPKDPLLPCPRLIWLIVTEE